MKKRRLFLTGSEGFIGKNTLENLNSKYIIVSPKHRELDLLDTAAVDNFFLKNGDFDVVVHSAFLGGPRISKDNATTLKDNLLIFFNLEKNKKHYKKFINLGSGAEYGKHRSLIKIPEKEFGLVIPKTDDYYGFGKFLIGKYIENSSEKINLRLFGIYGPYENYSLRFISNAICKKLLGMPISIKKNVFFDYLYVDDFVRILDFFIEHDSKYHSYNVGTGKPIDLVTLANKINNIVPTKAKIKIKSKGLGLEYTCNNKRLMNEITNFKFMNVDDAILNLWKFYESRKNIIKKENLTLDY